MDVSSHLISSTDISRTSLKSNTWIRDATVTVKPQSSNHSAFTVSHDPSTSQHAPICTANYKDSMIDIAPSTSSMVIHSAENHRSKKNLSQVSTTPKPTTLITRTVKGKALTVTATSISVGLDCGNDNIFGIEVCANGSGNGNHILV